MTSTEAPFSTTAKDHYGNLHTIRGNDYDEFAANLARALGPDGHATHLARFTAAFGGNDTQVAVGNVAAAGLTPFPHTAAPNPVSTVGQPLPQPGATAPPWAPPAAPAQAPSAPPIDYPGNCGHGVRQFVDKPTKNGPWRRWECAIPWSKDAAASRCKPVNV